MAKSLLPYFLSALGLAAVTSGYLLYNNVNQPAPEVQSTASETETSQEQEVVSVQPEAETQAPAASVDAGVSQPVFSILRVEPDGSAVIGGTGPASSEIELFNGDASLGKTKTGPEGDFVFVLDKPLEAGLNELKLTATNESGEKIVSAESGIVNVPEPGKEEELTVVVTAEGQATRVMSQVETEANQEVAEAEPETPSEETQEVASVETDQSESSQELETSTSESQDANVSEAEVNASENEANAEIKTDVSNVEVNTETDNVSVSVKTDDEAAPASGAPAPVLIEAADIEGGKIFIAGTGEPGMNVNLYFGGEFLGRTKVSDNGAFLFEGQREVASGSYEIRADMTGLTESDVVARAQVKLVHEPEPVTTQDTVEVAKAEDAETQSGQSSAASDAEEVTEAASEETGTGTEESVSTDTQTEESVSPEVKAEAAPAAQETEATEEESEKVIRTGTAVIIRKGDNLWRIARRNYGAGIRYTTIFDANRDQIQDPNLIFPGQVFKVPEDEGSNDQG